MPNVFCHGQHICSLFETEREQLAVATEYLADGLRHGERCLFVGQSPESLARFRAALKFVGIDADDMVERGALVPAVHADAHLADGTFSSERMLGMLNSAVEAALNAGFAGLRTCGDMSWLLEEPSGAEHVVEYEALLNQFFKGIRGCGMCQYDRARLPAHLIDHALATHSSVTIDGRHEPNPFYEPPLTAKSRRAQPSTIAWKIGELKRRSDRSSIG